MAVQPKTIGAIGGQGFSTPAVIKPTSIIERDGEEVFVDGVSVGSFKDEDSAKKVMSGLRAEVNASQAQANAANPEERTAAAARARAESEAALNTASAGLTASLARKRAELATLEPELRRQEILKFRQSQLGVQGQQEQALRENLAAGQLTGSAFARAQEAAREREARAEEGLGGTLALEAQGRRFNLADEAAQNEKLIELQRLGYSREDALRAVGATENDIAFAREQAGQAQAFQTELSLAEKIAEKQRKQKLLSTIGTLGAGAVGAGVGALAGGPAGAAKGAELGATLGSKAF